MIEVNEIIGKLPESWVPIQLGSVVTPSKEKIDPLKFKEQKYIGLEHIEKDTGKLISFGSSKDVKSTKSVFHKGDLLYGKLRPYLNKVYYTQFSGVCSTDFLVFQQNDFIENKYLGFRLLCSDFVKFANGNTSGVQHPRTNFKILSRFIVPLPPLPEQNRIVAKIEELFTQLDKGVDELHKIKAQLKQYRQSVLKYAFEGKLTEEWRKEQSDLPTVDELAEQINGDRQNYYKTKMEEWEQEVEKWKVDGKSGKKPTKPLTYKESPKILDEEITVLPKIPKCWRYKRLAEISEIGSGMSLSKNREVKDPFEVPYLRVANVQRGRIVLDEVKKMNIEKNTLMRYELKKWDILFNEGGDRDKLGRGWIWEAKISPCITQNHVFRATLHSSNKIQAKFVSYWGNTFGRDYFERVGKQTTNLASINKTVLSKFPVPRPSISEQNQIVSEIERCFSIVDEIEKTVDDSLISAEHLRQTILKKAFTGKLVPQDENDEPASKLLERIKLIKNEREKCGVKK